jgi:hypothetical protein
MNWYKTASITFTSWTDSISNLGPGYEIFNKPTDKYLGISAIKNGKEVGYGHFYFRPNYIYPADIWVNKSFRRQGIATLIYLEAQKRTGLPIKKSITTPMGTLLQNKLIEQNIVKDF